MIYKNYLVEQNINILKNNFVLFYGENLGLINDFKEIIQKENQNASFLKFHQDEILKSQDNIFSHIRNISLFDENKIFFIESVNDKFLTTAESIHSQKNNYKFYFFAGLLEKKSKLRSYFEKSQNCDTVPCYKDNEISIKKIISKKLNDFSGLTPKVLNDLIQCCSLDRIKLNNELNKIKNFFINKHIDYETFSKLLNDRVDEDFSSIKDTALNGDKTITNNLLSSTIFESEKINFYINILNQRLNKLKEVISQSLGKNLSQIIDNIKPPIFWKDKPNFIIQAKKWNIDKINIALKKTYNVEINLRAKNNLNKDLLIKKLIIDICNLANS